MARRIENCPCCGPPVDCTCCCGHPNQWLVYAENLVYGNDVFSEGACSYLGTPIDLGDPAQQCSSFNGQFLLSDPEIVYCCPECPQGNIFKIWQSPVFQIQGLPDNVEHSCGAGCLLVYDFLDTYVWQIRCKMNRDDGLSGNLSLHLLPEYYINNRKNDSTTQSGDTRCNTCVDADDYYELVVGGPPDFINTTYLHIGCFCASFLVFQYNPEYVGNECSELKYGLIERNSNYGVWTCNFPRQTYNPIKNITIRAI